MDVRLPDGTVVTNVPEGITQAELLGRLQAGGYDVSWATPPKGETGLFPAARAGYERLKGEAALLGGKLGVTTPQEAEAYQKSQEEKAQRIFTPTEEGWTQAPFTKFKELLGGSLPYMAAPIAAGAAVAATPLTGTAALAAGIGAAGITSAAQFTGSNLARQMETGKSLDEASLGAAAAASIPQAALDVVAFRATPVIRKLFASVGKEITEDAAQNLAKQGFSNTVKDYALTTGRTAGTEGLTEAGQAFFERLQAGLNIADDAARAEYLDNFIGGAVLGGALAPVGRYVERQKQVEEPLAPGQRRGETLEQTANRLNVEVQGLTEQLKPPPPSPILSSEQLASMAAEPDGYAKLIQYEESIKDLPRSPEKVASRQAARELRARLEIETQQRQTPADKPYPYDPFAPEPFQFKSSTELVDLINKIEDPADKLVRLLEYRAEVKNQPASAEREQALRDAGALYNEINKFAQEQGFPAPKPFTLRASDLIAAGIAKKDPLFAQLKGKDINKPDDVDTVVKLAEDAQRRPDITPELFDRLEGLLTSVEAHIRDKPGSGFYGQRTYPKPSGTGVPVAGEPKPPVPTGGAEPSGRMGMVGPTASAAPTVPREAAPSAPVEKAPVSKPETPVVVAEAPPVPSVEPVYEPGLEVGPSETVQELEAELRKVEQEKTALEKPRFLQPGQVVSLFSAIKGKLNRSDVVDISPDRRVRVLTNNQGQGTFVSELVNDSKLDKWLPPGMRPGARSYDVQESTEYIKNLLRNRDHTPYEIKQQLARLDLTIADLDQAIETEKQLEILIRQANAEFQAASEERRAEETELIAPERAVGSVVRAEKPAARAQLGKPEPLTIDVEARVIEETVGPQVARLPASQVALLEAHYGEKAGTQSFLDKVKEDVVLFANKGASAVAEAIRAVIKAIHAGVISVSLIFNPINISQPEALLIVPKAEAKVETAKPTEAPAEVAKPEAAKLAQVPDNVEGMSEAARQAYQTLIPSLKDTIGDKLIVIADKPSARLFVFTSDGELVVQNKALFGAAKGDLYNGNVNVPSNRITPAGLFGLKLVDAKTGPSAKRTAGEYDFGKVFALEDPEAVITIMHSVWLKDSDAAMRQAALRSPDATDSRYSYGCINVDQATFKYLLDNYERQMDGAKMFVVPDNQAQIKEFLYGDIAKNIGGLKPGEGPDRLVREAVKRMSLAKVAPQVSEKKFQELERRAKQPSKPAPAKEEPEEVKAIQAERAEKISQLQGVLEKILAKYGLKDVKLNLEEGMKDHGSYEGQLIKLALDLDSPVQTLRHEAIHALKELGFFTPQQWKVLTDRAKNEWIEKYLKNQIAVVDGKEVTRYDAYMDLYKGDQDKIIEEAIADAFGDFVKTKAPPGMMQAILTRMKNLFKAIKEALNKGGYETAEDVFGKIEEGKLTKAEKLVEQVDAQAKPVTQLSLRAPDTKEFDTFFGDSQIVDKKGEPQVMYHGTARDITSFVPKQAGAIFVTDDPNFAETFSKMSADWMAKHADQFLSPEQLKAGREAAIKQIRKDYKADPELRDRIIAALDDPKSLLATDANEILAAQYKDKLPTGPNIMPVFVRAENPFDFQNPDHIRQLQQYEAENKYTPNSISNLMGFVERGAWEAIEDRFVQQAIKQLGFDGFYVKEGGKKNLAVYSATQIKSAIGNEGTYDITNADIRKSLRTRWSDDRVNSLLNKYAYTTDDNDTKAYAAFIRPEDFLNATSSKEYRQVLETERTPLDVERLAAYDQEIYLEIAPTDEEGVYEIKGHEGRHRMMALQDAGVPSVPVVLVGRPYGRIKNATVVEEAYLKPQAFEKGRAPRGIFLWEMIPINYAEAKNLKETFGGKADIRFSLRTLPALPTDVTERVKETVIFRDRPGLVDRLLDAISPRRFSQFRKEFVNRYDALASLDRQAAEQIRLMGGVQQLADAKAESAALFSDLGGGLAASAMGVHDRVGGIPVYVRKYIVEKDFQKIGPDYTTKAAAEAAARRIPGAQVFEQGYTQISNANGVKGLIAIFADLAKYAKPDPNEPSVFDQYQFWADVKRASKYIINPQTGKYEEKLFTKDDIRRAAQIEKAFPEFVQIQKEWIKYNDGLVDFMRDTGVISEAGAKEMKKHGDYFPFYRHLGEDDIQGPRLFSSIANVKTLKKAKGSEAAVTDFFETIVRNTQSAIQAGIKNVAARRATDQAMRIKEVFKLPRADSGPSVYRVLEDGKEVYYRAQDPLFIDALKSLNQPDLPFIGLLAGPAKLLRTLVTKDPAFQLANMMRDSLSAYVSSGFKFTPIVATLKQYAATIAGKSPEFVALRNAGVIGGYDYSRGVETSARKLEDDMRKAAKARTGMEKLASPVTSLWGALEKSSEASDAATRQEVYKRVLAETGNEAEALYQALEVMNFNRKGRSPIIRILTAAVPFMNARIQGLDVLYRSGMRPIWGADATEQEKARLKTFWVRGMTMMALSSMYWMLTSDDDDYKKQEQETRDNYWLIPSLGIKIPIPFEIGVMFKVIPERVLEYAFGDDTGKDFMKSMSRHFLSTFGFNPIPQAILPAIEITANYSFFTQRPIITQGMENISPEYQVGPNTSKVAGAVGQTLGISPIKLDHLIQGYTGTMGMYAVNLFDSIFSMNDEAPKPSRRLEQMPVLRRFMVDPEARGQITAYYDLKNSVDEVVRTSNYLERSMDFEQYGKYMQENIKMFAAREYINDLEKTMKDFREMKNLIRISKMDADDKRDSLTNIGRMEQQLTQNIRTLKKQVAEQ